MPPEVAIYLNSKRVATENLLTAALAAAQLTDESAVVLCSCLSATRLSQEPQPDETASRALEDGFG